MRRQFRLDRCHAVITGASSGLGAEFARQLAPRAHRLLLVARRADALAQVRQEIQAGHPKLQVHLCPADVTTEAGRSDVIRRVDDLRIDPNLLINNAGRGDYGSFGSAEASTIQAQVDLNIVALLLLTRALLPGLCGQASADRPAAVLNVSSLAGELPLPDAAVYAASKAFVTSFSAALGVELADRHVLVSALCPGPTPTPFSQTARRAGGADTHRGGQGMLRMPPEVVVRRGLEALQQGEAQVFPGLGVRLAAVLFRAAPRWLVCRMLLRRHRAGGT